MIVPLLPVRVDAAMLTWPQAGSARSIEAPLVSYAPLTFDAALPCAVINQLSAKCGVLAATGPAGAPNLERYGFVARVRPPRVDTAARLDVVLRNQALLSVSVDELVADCELIVHADTTGATATLVGFEAPGFPVVLNGDYDWRRDWGELQQFSRIDATAAPARPATTEQDHSGLWTPGRIITDY
ncbi:arabinosyltransferase C-terminal domain-containing protein [Nocardia sp. NPDC051463]|uniref:arabinosyltransferase C-terminal domain-containing protein n=1 Tax=Nocardia sp. NPDC051463 TaxID=3154845 RepID=UPI00344BD793